jgi:DNA repair protein RadA/Sms
VLAAVEGTRPLLVELQSLVVDTSFSMPRRSATGIDSNRLYMIVAILEERGKFALGKTDIFVNVAGGFKISEPAADLGLALSIASNRYHAPLPGGSVVIGELGLTGEVRRVAQLDRRLQEAARRGFTRAFIPPGGKLTGRYPGLDLVEVPTLAEALSAAFPEHIRLAYHRDIPKDS